MATEAIIGLGDRGDNRSVANVRVSISLPATVHQAESCWYDTDRWSAWVEGLGQVLEIRGPWPAPGSSVRWESGPSGRGEVSERVLAHEPLSGQAIELEDDWITGEQRVSFVPTPGGVEVVLELTYRIKRRNPLTPLIDLLFIRRLMAGSLQRTLSRFGAELAGSVCAEAR